MPSTAQCRGVEVSSLPVAERDGLLFVWPGEGAPAPAPPAYGAPPSGHEVLSEQVLEVPRHWAALVEALLLEAAPSPSAPPPGLRPPCVVVSSADAVLPGSGTGGERVQVHQLLAALPSRPGRTRLLYRASTDGGGWASQLPGVGALWRRAADKVLGEGLARLAAAPARAVRGGDDGGQLVARFRRWRSALAGLGHDGSRLTAAEMFNLIVVGGGEEEGEEGGDGDAELSALWAAAASELGEP